MYGVALNLWVRLTMNLIYKKSFLYNCHLLIPHSLIFGSIFYYLDKQLEYKKKIYLNITNELIEQDKLDKLDKKEWINQKEDLKKLKETIEDFKISN